MNSKNDAIFTRIWSPVWRQKRVWSGFLQVFIGFCLKTPYGNLLEAPVVGFSGVPVILSFKLDISGYSVGDRLCELTRHVVGRRPQCGLKQGSSKEV